MTPAEALNLFRSDNGELWPMFVGGKFFGMISRLDLERAATAGIESIQNIPSPMSFPHVHADHTLDVVLHRMGSTGMKVLPVVSRSDIRSLQGIITLDDVLRVFALQEADYSATSTGTIED